MSIWIDIHGANAATVNLGSTSLFFSYNTLVGIRSPYASITKKYSPTTTRHISKYFSYGDEHTPYVEGDNNRMAKIAIHSLVRSMVTYYPDYFNEAIAEVAAERLQNAA